MRATAQVLPRYVPLGTLDAVVPGAGVPVSVVASVPASGRAVGDASIPSGVQYVGAP